MVPRTPNIVVASPSNAVATPSFPSSNTPSVHPKGSQSRSVSLLALGDSLTVGLVGSGGSPASPGKPVRGTTHPYSGIPLY